MTLGCHGGALGRLSVTTPPPPPQWASHLRATSEKKRLTVVCSVFAALLAFFVLSPTTEHRNSESQFRIFAIFSCCLVGCKVAFGCRVSGVGWTVDGRWTAVGFRKEHNRTTVAVCRHCKSRRKSATRRTPAF